MSLEDWFYIVNRLRTMNYEKKVDLHRLNNRVLGSIVEKLVFIMRWLIKIDNKYFMNASEKEYIKAAEGFRAIAEHARNGGDFKIIEK